LDYVAGERAVLHVPTLQEARLHVNGHQAPDMETPRYRGGQRGVPRRRSRGWRSYFLAASLAGAGLPPVALVVFSAVLASAAGAASALTGFGTGIFTPF